jgi:glycosyltransferase involved in cell wall biosynthesis
MTLTDHTGSAASAAEGQPRILIAAPCDFVEFPVGGYTTFVRNILPSLGPEVCALGVDEDSEGAARTGIESGGRTVTYLSAGVVDPGSVVPARVQIGLMVRRLGEQVRAWRPSVIYSNSPEMTVALSLVTRGSGIPIVQHIHEGATNTAHSPHAYLRNPVGTGALTWLLDEAVRRSCLVLGVSDHCSEVAERAGTPFVLVPSCVDVTLFHPAEPPKVDAGIRIASVGRLDGVKNTQLLLRAVRHLLDDGADASVVIAGDGPSRGELDVLSRELALEDRVRFEGPVGPQRAAEMFREANVTALTSLWEGLPIAMLEAMASGLPVVAPRLPGIARAVDDGVDGVLFDDYEPAAVADAIARAHADGERLGRAARETVVQRYSGEVVGAVVRDILEDVARGRLPDDPGVDRT